MPADELVVSNTSPLLNLALVGRLELLSDQFESLVVPEIVRDELLAGERGVEELRAFLNDSDVSIVPVSRDGLYVEFASSLDRGEAATLSYAVERNADLVLIDERDGRAVARRHDVSVTGVVGILLRAARQGDVEIEPALDELRDVGFWIGDDLYHRAIDVANETSDSDD